MLSFPLQKNLITISMKNN